MDIIIKYVYILSFFEYFEQKWRPRALVSLGSELLVTAHHFLRSARLYESKIDLPEPVH